MVFIVNTSLFQCTNIIITTNMWSIMTQYLSNAILHASYISVLFLLQYRYSTKGSVFELHVSDLRHENDTES